MSPAPRQIRPSRTVARAATVMLGAVLLSGCTSVTRVFPDRSPDEVWTALVGVAQTPSYEGPDPTDRWTVVSNDVFTDPEAQKIRIHRQLERDLRRPLTKPLVQERTWKFEVRLEPTDPPSAMVISHGAAVPGQARLEAERYLQRVAAVLDTEAEHTHATFGNWVDSLGTDPDAPPPRHRVYDD